MGTQIYKRTEVSRWEGEETCGHVAKGESPEEKQVLGTTASCNTLPWVAGEGLRQYFGLKSDSWKQHIHFVVGKEVKEKLQHWPSIET